MKIDSILYVEDEDSIREQLSSYIQRFCRKLYLAADGKKGLEMFYKYSPDIIISDIKMPKMNGIEMVKNIKSINSRVPVLFTTAHSESDYTLEAIDLQVNGYILKPIEFKKLSVKLKQMIAQLLLQKENVKNEEILKEMAYKDSLTKIYNRQRFDEELQREINRFKRIKEPLTLLMFDIDFFKDFNDRYGHQMGDEILIQISELVSKNIREMDIFARWGGEEFMLLLPGTDIDSGFLVAQSLRKRIQEHIFMDKLRVTVSFGVASFNRDDDSVTFLKRVDDALYSAKKSGRNTVVVG
jgi:diguanylate cyclase (GGDEF)-like protein